MDSIDFINHFIALFVISNPLSALPAVLKITKDMSLNEKRRIGVVSAFTVAIILTMVTWIGIPLLMIIGVGIPSFQVAGALVLLLLAFSMLYAEESAIKSTPVEQKEKRDDLGAIVPLAIPIIAGPGAISSVIISVSEYPGLINQVMITLSCLLVALTMGALLYFSGNIEKIIGKSGIHIINRVGGLILAAIAIQSLADGLIAIFPGLQG
jgi:multiple antibiotic resistance protein